MHLRQDAVAAAAEWISAVESLARNHAGSSSLVATVGKLHAEPNAGNVIAGKASLSLDARSDRNAVREAAVEELLRKALAIATKRGIYCSSRIQMEQPAVPMDEQLTAVRAESIEVARQTSPPEVAIGDEVKIRSEALSGDEDLQGRHLMPDGANWDFAVNTMTYAPGAALSRVEIHVMEHSLLMLSGGGIYRLGDNWYPVASGDFIWMAPYCPRWFDALGKTPAKYLIYKDWYRHSISPIA